MGEFTYTFGAVGRNYETPQAAHDDNVGDLLGDTDKFFFKGYDDADFTEGLVVSGSTTSADYNMTFEAAAGEEYERRADTGVWIAEDTDNVIEGNDDYVHFRGFGVENTTATSNGYCFRNNGTAVLVERVYAESSTKTAAAGACCHTGAGSTTWRDMLVIGGVTAGANDGVAQAGGLTVAVQNVVSRGFRRYGIRVQEDSAAINCISTDNGTDFRIDGSATVTYSSSSDTTAVGTGNQISKSTANTFADAAGGDYRLKDGADQIDAGLDPSTFTLDFDRVPWGTATGNWHMGAYDTPVAAAGSIDGTAAGTSSAVGTLSGRGALAGAAAGSASAAGTLSGRGALAGSAAGSASASGSIIDATPSGSISGSAAGSASAAGLLIGRGALAGSAAGSSSAAGSLIGRLPASGSIAGTSSASGSLSGIGILLATAAGTAAAAATISAIGTLQAGAAGVASASGSLRDGSAPLASRAVSVSRGLRADRVISKDFRVDGPSEGLTI